MSNGKLVSLLPSEMVQGGLIDDLDVEFTAALFTIFDYQGKADPRVCLRVDMKDDEGNLHEQYFSAADPKHFAPSDDGNGIVAVSEKGALIKGSNYDGFMSSLINAGFPESNLREGIGGLVGTKVHVARKAAPKRSGIINQPGQENREQTVLVVTKIISLPGQGGAAKAKATTGPKAAPAAGGAKAAPAKAAPVAAAGGDDDALVELVNAKLAEAGEASTKDLVAYVFKNGKGNKKAMTQRVATAEFLEAGMEAGHWLYDGEANTVTAAPQ